MIVTEAKVEELRIAAKASGRPQDIAKYSIANRDFEALKTQLFDGQEYSYASVPAESYLARLQQEAESGDEVSVMRYQMIKANHESFVNRHEEARLLKEGIASMRRLLTEGGKVTNAHVSAARKIVVHNPIPENLAMLSMIKREYESQQAE